MESYMGNLLPVKVCEGKGFIANFSAIKFMRDA